MEMDDDNVFMGPAVSRLETPLSLRDVISKCPNFAIHTEEGMVGEEERETDMAQVYDYERLEPYALYEILEPDSDCENDDNDPIRSFPVYRKQMECITDDGKIMKKLEQCGVGNVVGDEEKVVVYFHYEAYSEFNEYPFDASRLRHKKPLVVRIGVDSLILGLALAIRSMKKGEKSKFLIHPDYAYQERGVPPRIPANATLLYSIELVDFTVNEALTLQLRNDEDDDTFSKRTIEEALKLAEQLRNHGNKLKKIEKKIDAAIGVYRKALRLLIEFHYQNAQDENKGRKQMLKLYSNLAVCFMEKKMYKRVCIMYNDARHDCPGLAEKHCKLLYNSGKALRFLGDYNEAAKRLKQAKQLQPDDQYVLRELKILNEETLETEATERRRCEIMFGFKKNKKSDGDDDDKLIEELIDQVNEEFKNIVVDEIHAFVQSEEDSIKLNFGATSAEKEFCRILCKKNKLSFRELKVDGEARFVITKKF